MQKTTSLEKLLSFKHIVILSIPIFLELLLQIVVGYSDQVMISKDQDAVTAITNTNSIVNVFIIAFQVFSVGAIILISHYKGSKNYDGEKSVYSVSFLLAVMIGLISSIILIIFPRKFFTWVGLDSSCMDKGILYMRVIGGFLFLQAVLSTISAFLKSNSYMKDSTIINAIVNILNIIGNFILIPNFGILGVAISSVISRFIGVIIISIVFVKRVKVNIFRHPIKNFDFTVMKKIFGIGGPSASESLSYNLSQILVLAIVNGLGNKGLVNLRAYILMFANVTYLFTIAVSQAMQVVIGELIGMGKVKETRTKVHQTMILSAISSTIISIILLILGENILKIFNISDPELLRISKILLTIQLVLEFGRGFNIVYIKALQTMGDVVYPTIISIIFCWSIAVFGGYLLGGKDVWLNLGLIGIWIAMAVDECVRAVIFIFRFKGKKWERKLII